MPWTLEPPSDPAELSSLEAEFNSEVEAMKSKILSCQKFILDPSVKFVRSKRDRGAHLVKVASEIPVDAKNCVVLQLTSLKV